MGDLTDQSSSHDAPPVSSFQDSIRDLLRHRLLEPPVNPGLLAGLDDYEILRVIGLGGMGLVLLGREPGRTEPVVIKLIRPELARDTRSVQRFLAEARHMRQFGHEGIVPVLAISDSPQKPYFVMPFLRGGNLADLIKAAQPLDHPVILRIVRRVAEALAYAHGKGIIHRDLKPANVLLNEKQEAYLTDFGLARDVHNTMVADINREHLEGTAAYMSPAVAQGKAEDTRCDIYGLGAVLYEMLADRPPYQGKTSKEILEKVRTSPPVPIRELKPLALAGLVTIAEGAMARELRDRYAEMADVVRDLNRVAAGQAPFGPRASGERRSATSSRATAGVKGIWTGGIVLLAVAAAVVVWLRDCSARLENKLASPRTNSAAGPAGGSGSPVVAQGLEIVRRMEWPDIWNWAGARVGRWEGHREPVLFLPHANKVVAFSTSGTLASQSSPLDPRLEGLALCLVRDLVEDASDDVVASWASGRYVFLSLLNQNLQEVKRFALEGRWKPSATGDTCLSRIETDWIGDLEGDGRLEVREARRLAFRTFPPAAYPPARRRCWP